MEQRVEMEGGGTLILRQEGPRVRLEAEKPADGKGLYKVWLRGDRGGKLLLGTLAPEGNRLTLRRMMSIGELERAGCWPQFRAEARLTFSFSGEGESGWYCEQHPGHMISDPVSRGQIEGAMLCRKGGNGRFSLAAPFRTDRPVPLTALFCLASVEQVEGRYHLVWSFDKAGWPVPVHKERKVGDPKGQ